jgi:hypothetical protein
MLSIVYENVHRAQVDWLGCMFEYIYMLLDHYIHFKILKTGFGNDISKLHHLRYVFLSKYKMLFERLLLPVKSP